MEQLDLRPFVVTGCARSGTTYMAILLGRLGLRCGHEVVFGPRTRRFEGFSGQHGDSSWLAVPFLEDLPESTVVIHRVRHPLRVVRSLTGIRFFEDRNPAFLALDDVYTRGKWRVREGLMARGHVEPSSKGPRPHHVYRSFVEEFAPDVLSLESPLERSLRYWATWNQRIESTARARGLTYIRQRVEGTSADDLVASLGVIGLPVTAGHLQLVVDQLPRDINTKRVAALEWSDLPAGPDRAAAEILATTYGYDPELPDQNTSRAGGG